MSIDLVEIFKRIIKYLLEGFIVCIAAFVLPLRTLKLEEIFMIGLIAACTFAVLDVFVPSIATSARTGAGAGIGFNLVGFGV